MTWKGERGRHSLASRGVKTKPNIYKSKGEQESKCAECGSTELTMRNNGYYCYDCGHEEGEQDWCEEERTFTVDKDGEIRNYEATKGSVWMSGYDERLYDDLEGLEPGKYRVSFKGSEDGGSDAIDDVEIVRVS